MMRMMVSFVGSGTFCRPAKSRAMRYTGGMGAINFLEVNCLEFNVVAGAF